jgi:hypothetical protein
LAARNDPREVIGDPNARYYGVTVTENSLVPADGARLGEIHFGDWLGESAPQTPAPEGQSTAEMRAVKV